MARDDPSEVALQIGAFKRSHQQWAIANYGRFIKTFEDGYEVLVNIIRSTNFVDKSAWSQHRGVQFFFAADSLKRLFRAMEDAVEGFYDETIVLTRSVYETFLRIVFISCFPADWAATIFKPEKGKQAFNATNFPHHTLRVDWDFIYKTHSVVSHNIYDVMRRLAEPQGYVGLVLKGDEKAMGMAVNSLTFTLWALLHVSRILFVELGTERVLVTEAYERIAITDEALGGLVATTPSLYGKTAEEVRKVGHIVRAAEQNQDWRTLV